MDPEGLLYQGLTVGAHLLLLQLVPLVYWWWMEVEDQLYTFNALFLQFTRIILGQFPFPLLHRET